MHAHIKFCALLPASSWMNLRDVLPDRRRSCPPQRRHASAFSGPGLLPGEQEVGGVEYKLQLLDPTPTRFQQLVSKAEAARQATFCADRLTNAGASRCQQANPPTLHIDHLPACLSACPPACLLARLPDCLPVCLPARLRAHLPACLPVCLQVTQLNWRLAEGCGECLYALGVEDNGHPLGLCEADLRGSLEVLSAMAAEVGAEAQVLQVRRHGSG